MSDFRFIARLKRLVSRITGAALAIPTPEAATIFTTAPHHLHASDAAFRPLGQVRRICPLRFAPRYRGGIAARVRRVY